jgi:predicted glycogen debranching enzyme
MRLPAINITQEALSRFDETIQKEWLVTNGLGGYASSSVLGINTRKYHGLLVAALHPPIDRNVCLEKLDEEVTVDKNLYLLGTNEFQGAVFPRGFIHLREFSVSPFPKYIYSVQGVEIRKTIFMPSGKNATIVSYHVWNGSSSEVKVRIFPLLTCRHYHSVIDKSAKPLSFSQQQNNNSEVQLTFNVPKAAIAVRTTEGEFHEKPNWIERLLYREEEMRGESSVDDCYQPGYFEITVPPKQEKVFTIAATAGENGQQNAEALNSIGTRMSDVENLLSQELTQRQNLLTAFYGSHETIPVTDWLSWILLAADTFMVKGVNNRESVIAGYHWYEVWGRDTFISLPGLMLVTSRLAEAQNTFFNFNEHCWQGLVPNFLKDKSGKPSYNTVDATLWYVNAVLQYLKYTGDFEFVKSQLWENLKEIVENHVKGTAFGIHMDYDGLLAHGPRLTWMDAEVNGEAITPRAGKAVEIQALWYNALRIAQLLAERFEEKNLAETYAFLATKVKSSFNEKFWNAEKNCLFDVVNEFGADASLRSNQVIVAALDFTMLDQEKNERIVDVVQRELLTPCGLRTLARSDPKYRGVYSGDRRSRDSVYHNGTVWPWLLGPFTEAFLKVKGYTALNREYALKNFVAPLFTQQISQAGLGTINEIFDGDAPFTPRGCISQAWSVAEPLRAYVEDVMLVRPQYEKEVLQA